MSQTCHSGHQLRSKYVIFRPLERAYCSVGGLHETARFHSSCGWLRDDATADGSRATRTKNLSNWRPLTGDAGIVSLRTRAFLDGLRELGYVEGRTIEIDWKWGQDRVETLSDLAAELVRSNADVIVTGGTSAAQALKAATSTIPIVMAIIGDPVAAGLVGNLARPAGNLTGFSIVAPELGGKRLEMLKEMVPGVSSVAVLLNNRNPQSQIELKEMWSAAQAMGLHLYPTEISTEVGLEDAFAAMKKAAVQALVVLTDPILFSQRKRTVDLANKNLLPAMYFFQGFAEEGGLMSYGPSDADLFRRTAGYVDRILKGAKPGDLPIE